MVMVCKDKGRRVRNEILDFQMKMETGIESLRNQESVKESKKMRKFYSKVKEDSDTVEAQESSASMEISVSATSNMVAARYIIMWLLDIWNVAAVTKELNF